MKFTRTTPLPGGQVTPGFNAWLAELAGWMPPALLDRLARAYGTRLDRILDGVESISQLGRHFGAGLYEAEVRYLVDHEFARTAEDILWRRTKLGLALGKKQQADLARWLGTQPTAAG
jgi:glycerol-3-phosphate dehydrogenase